MEDEFSQLTDEEGRPLKAARPAFAKPVPQKVEEEGVEVPYEALAPETLEQLIKAFIFREGTDYGVQEALLASKVEQVKRQLQRGEAKIVFDLASETGSIVPTKK